MYSNHYPMASGPHGLAHGFCSSCCHPAAQCHCRRSCRKIEKELLVRPDKAAGTDDGKYAAQPSAAVLALMDVISPIAAAPLHDNTATAAEKQDLLKLRGGLAAGRVAAATGQAVIGGGCCVHLSIEYMTATPVAPTTALTAVLVMDSKATIMAWMKVFNEGGHHVKEGIIATNPGAQLMVISMNAITRVRWCEVISC